MRAIKVTFRAVFQQPIGKLNPMGAKIGGPMPVELFPSLGGWVARYISPDGTYRGSIYNKLGRFVTLEHAKATVEANFQERLEPWQMWGKPPDSPVEIMLTPYELADLGDGKFAWIDDEDRTHILHAQTIPYAAKMPPAACGAQVNAKCSISTKANIEPTCRGCAEVWRKEYQRK
jgi:hypothetical protein